VAVLATAWVKSNAITKLRAIDVAYCFWMFDFRFRLGRLFALVPAKDGELLPTPVKSVTFFAATLQRFSI
jgi:hypothetical protein